jgi:hypothetical protein
MELHLISEPGHELIQGALTPVSTILLRAGGGTTCGSERSSSIVAPREGFPMRMRLLVVLIILVGAILLSPCPVLARRRASTPPKNAPSQSFILSTSTGGTGGGAIFPAGGIYPDGTVVTLTATAVSGSTLTAWSGACAGTSNTCTLTMNSDKMVTAIFTLGYSYVLPNPLMPNACVGVPYSFNLDRAVGGTAPYYYVKDTASQFPPFGLVIQPAGFLTGTPTVADTRIFTVDAVDLSGHVASSTTSLTVLPVCDLTGKYTGTFTITDHFNSGSCMGMPFTYDGSVTLSLVQTQSNLTGTATFTGIKYQDSKGGCFLVAQPPLVGNLVGQTSGNTLTLNLGVVFNGSVSGDTITMSDAAAAAGGGSFTFTVKRISSTP